MKDPDIYILAILFIITSRVNYVYLATTFHWPPILCSSGWLVESAMLHQPAGGKCYAPPANLMKFTVQWSATKWLVEHNTFHWPAGGA